VSDGVVPAPSRPAVWVNCAVSIDGRLAFAASHRARLSSPEDLARVQRLRANADAILVGVGTILTDDPALRVHWDQLHEPAAGPDPYRIVVDGSGRTPPQARVLDGSAPTIVATSRANSRTYPAHVERIVAGAASVDLEALFVALAQRGVRRLMVEGGSRILASVLRGGLFDRLSVYYAPQVIGGSTAPSLAGGPDEDASPVGLTLVELERMGEGYVATYVPVGRTPLPGA
jgi:2,5-diamino-6-(ribosylamino)-4(3H)-pyrimidinone 5'-phosphate reductase